MIDDNSYIHITPYTTTTVTCTSTEFEQCYHENGWYTTIPYCFIFRKEVFVCVDCEKILDKDKKRRV